VTPPLGDEDEANERQPSTRTRGALGEIADWGPAEDCSDWADSSPPCLEPAAERLAAATAC